MAAVTAKQVAEEIGVAISTVGRALADDPRISAETKAIVRQAARKLGYVGNLPARMMRGESSGLIGLIIPDIRNDFYSAIAQALSSCLNQESYRLALSITNDDRDEEERHVRWLLGARTDGIILVPGASPRRETVSMLGGVPHLQLLREIDALKGDWFGIDDSEALFNGTTHLIQLGHRCIAYVGGHRGLSTGSARVEGFRRACKAASVAKAASIEQLGPTTAAYGRDATLALLQSKRPPTGLISGSVHITQGIFTALTEAGKEVPRDISLVGFGDPPWFDLTVPRLTTTRPPVGELATACGLWFIHRLKSKDRPPAPHRTVMASTLIIRDSTRRFA